METVDIRLSNLSFAQKLNLMEAIWDDLTKKEKTFESPAWHEDVLEKINKALASGKVAVSDWDEAKKRIRKNVVCE